MPSGRPFWFFYDVTVVSFFCDVIDDVIDFPEPLGLFYVEPLGLLR